MYRYRANGLQTCGLRTGVVVDIHAGCDQGSQLGSHAPLLPEEFLREMGRFKPDLVVDLGDRINNVNRAEDTLHLHRLVAFLSQWPSAVESCTYRAVVSPESQLLHW